MSTASKDSRLPLPSSKRRPRITRAPQSVRSPKSTTICACCMPASVYRAAPSMAWNWRHKRSARWSIRCCGYPTVKPPCCWPPASVTGAANTTTYSMNSRPRVSCAPASTARWSRSTLSATSMPSVSTTSKRWSIASVPGRTLRSDWPSRLKPRYVWAMALPGWPLPKPTNAPR